VLYYDENSFYVNNQSSSLSHVSPFVFERVDSSGNALNKFEGVRWAQFYPSIYPQSCVRLLIPGSTAFLNPPQCQAYNSEVWPERGRSLDFWTTQAGSSQFRVLWNEEEVARCPTGSGVCEVYVP
jgi:hypothetical protein